MREGLSTDQAIELMAAKRRIRQLETELAVATYEYFADRDPLQRAVMDRMLAGVSTRRFARVGEPVGEDIERASSSKSKSTVSEMFIEKTRTALEALLARIGITRASA